MIRSIRILALLFILALSSCDVTKSLFRSKQASITKETSDVTTHTKADTRTSSAGVRASTLIRDGMLSIAFDSLTSIRISPSGEIQATGFSPTIFGTVTETRRDTASSSQSSATLIQTDSTGRRAAEGKIKSEEVDKHKEQTTQKIGPILLLGLLIIIAVIILIQSPPRLR
jgi:hypothetical protein